ncbi:MAG: GNAT family N-acetyltransferase [Chloroflexota bacterium]|nr:GNAT family N-acetyltransferase [Chloroflexota bacterium]MDE2885596.1 GNAT family N-acetyltransferase [Chloroflexota bacterium]
MEIPDGHSDVPAGKTASVVTHLQMFERPQERAERSESSWNLRKVDPSAPDRYRTLFRRIGEDWLWTSRLLMSDDELRDVLGDPLYEAYVFEAEGQAEGVVELDFRNEDECEISFFGLTPAMVGKGAGRWMMNRVLELAWTRTIRRLWVHTCSLDHPRALDFYIRSGFVPFRRQIEVTDDPRATGLLPRTAAPHVPLL